MAVMIVLLALGAILVGLLAFQAKKKADRRLADSREEAQRWYERLGGQTLNLVADGDNPAAKQALVDASERYTAAGAQLERAQSRRQYELAADTAIEGLQYVKAARLAMGLDAGPHIPRTSGQLRAGSVTERMEADVDGHRYVASPTPTDDARHYYPGGMVKGRPVPGGWYSEPWWKTALVAGAWGIGSMMVFDALISPGFGTGAVDGAYADGYADGASDYGSGGDYAGGGDFGGGDFGGGDFGGGF
ncbi:hypothetical protein [Stackebrandtia nassauensis]|uniref:DUF1542 domain-containing protein n=1 Tax=Stackebrandtia nassauensis (strain DSM 44728 / CIP 108903 / NRRL B-16338 / NBRC 102104 / LLR-40K-21) TaxID=446470 RepID=D3PWU2_STANL|nr:hypothetical protein [Stackebrandtia nassauensis]ADD45166.1 hypothetical protein Snas_5535 [Stackebrandtia nassauensis DSM 44728]